MGEDELIEIEVSKLTPHPLNVEVYGDEEADPELVASIRENGQLERLVINNDNVIISGHRRWLALKVLGLLAKCRKAKFEDENREREALIEFNRQREKVPSQIYNEAKTLRELYAKEGRSEPFDAEKPQVLNSAPGEKTRDKISAMVGVKRDKLSKIIEICKAAESGDEYAIKLKERMDSGEKTVHAAHSALQMYAISSHGGKRGKFAYNLLMKIETGAISENFALRRLADYDKKTRKPEDKEKVIVKNPGPGPEPEESKLKDDVFLLRGANVLEISISESKFKDDSVLFILTPNESISTSIKIMECFGFKYQSSCVLYSSGETYENKWFKVVHISLLIGTKGNPPDPAKTECNSMINMKDKKLYDIIEVMYPNLNYAYLCKKPDEFNRVGWDVYDIGLYEINISERVYKSISKNKWLIENIFTTNKYDKDYVLEPEEVMTDKTTTVTVYQLNRLKKLAEEHDAKDINEVIIRLHEGFRNTHPFQQFAAKKGIKRR